MQWSEWTEAARTANPVDVIESVAAMRDWRFERSCEDEIAVSAQGSWADYDVSFSWMERIEALHLACAFRMRVPAHREVEVLRLLARINEGLVIGHFDLWPSEGAILFRHSLILSDGAQPSRAQAERLLAEALGACERHFQAFQFVVWADRSAEDALRCAVFETVGSA